MPELAKNSVHTVTIGGYNSSGQGVAHVGGHTVFVKNALQNEICKISILKTSRNIAYAKPIEIIAPSPHRTTPACANFGKCGGCDFMHMDYSEESELKRMRVKDALNRIGGFDIDVPPAAAPDKTEGYRNKAVYAVGKVGGRTAAGFYRERSHDIIPAETCVIQSDVSRRAAGAVTSWMAENRIPPYDEKNRAGCVRRIFCRYAAATNTAQIALVASHGRAPHTDRLIDGILERCPETSGIMLNVDRSSGNSVFSGGFKALWGAPHIVDKLCGLEFMLSPRSFYQINSGQADRLYQKTAVFAALNKNDTALDFFCGAGTISLLLAQYAGRVIGVEIVEDAITDARANAELNGITNAEFICADALEAAKTLKQDGISPSVIVTDPPRRGLTPDVINAIAGLSPERVIYISCDPATLARDLKAFRMLGYPLMGIELFDMFPRCAHIECCCLLRKL